MNRTAKFLVSATVYYAKCAILTVITYFILIFVFERKGISFTQWALIMALSFTIAYVPISIAFVRELFLNKNLLKK